MSDGPNNHARHDVRGLFLLFATGQRPDREAIHKFASAQPGLALTFDPSARPPLFVVNDGEAPKTIAKAKTEASASDQAWVELLRDGLTFDLLGLSPGDAPNLPEIEFRFDSRENVADEPLEGLQLIPSSHLAGGETSLPVLRGMFGLARDLVQHFEQVEAIVWAPSYSAIGRRFFESSITAWLEGGAFPALGLTAFHATIDGGLESVGLGFLIGQELRIEPALAQDKAAATRLGVRLINQLVLTGPIERSEQIIGPDGQLLLLEPSGNKKFIRVLAG